MASIFESTTRIAINELITKHAKESKFGLLISKESLRDLNNDLYDLLVTSRNLKSAGDRILKEGLPTASKSISRGVKKDL